LGRGPRNESHESPFDDAPVDGRTMGRIGHDYDGEKPMPGSGQFYTVLNFRFIGTSGALNTLLQTNNQI
jgi:hypothetical protein